MKVRINSGVARQINRKYVVGSEHDISATEAARLMDGGMIDIIEHDPPPSDAPCSSMAITDETQAIKDNSAQQVVVKHVFEEADNDEG